MKKIIIGSLASALLVVGLFSGGAWYAYHSGKFHRLLASDLNSAPSEELDKHKLQFVSLPETIVTLYDDLGNDHYVLLQLTLAAGDKEKAKRISDNLPLYQSAIIDTLSAKKFDDVRFLKVPEFRELLSGTLKKSLAARKMSVPFSDVLITKVVFQ